MNKIKIGEWASLEPVTPTYALVGNVDLVVIKWEDGSDVSVLYGRCAHRGALMADATIRGDDIVCGVHNWDYRYKTGVSAYNNEEALHRFDAWVENDAVWVDEDEITAWEKENPQAYDRDAYQGLYADLHGTPEEPYTSYIHELAEHGLDNVGHHGRVAAMGVPRDQLPRWEDIQFVTAQLHRVPALDDAPVGTELVIGPNAQRPLRLERPLFVSDMSFGALSEEAKTALARGAELAGTGICSGEGGMLPEEQASNSRYFYELASGRFGFQMDKVKQCQAFHFKCGQGAKTGTGGHLPGNKVVGRIAEVRGLEPGTPAVSPPRFPDWEHIDKYRDFAAEVRDETGGIPVGVKLSAQHIEKDIDAALEIGVDYIILDGRGGGTGAAPLLFRDNISVPTIPALARARRHLDSLGQRQITLIITGGLRSPADFAKAMAMGADGIAVSNAAIQAIGCLGMRACHTDNCPVGIATQKPDLRARLVVEQSARRLQRFFESATHLMQVMARACGHSHLNQLSVSDLTTWNRDTAYLTGVSYGGWCPCSVGGQIPSARRTTLRSAPWKDDRHPQEPLTDASARVRSRALEENMSVSPYLPLTLDEWRGTRDAVHAYSRVLGKIRQALAPPRKHWFHITLHAGVTGLRTSPMVKEGVAYELCLDLANHRLTAASSAGAASELAVEGQSVARFRDQALGMLSELGCNAELDPFLFEAEAPLVYNASDARRFWQALTRINGVFVRFRGSLREETGPVQLWPHHFDFAMLWFSGRLVPGVDPADEESADEQMNFGFSTGDELVSEPYFYITAHPTPSGLRDTPLPGAATWHSEGFVGALLPYAALVDSEDGDGLLLQFLSVVQAAGAKAMGAGG